MVKGKLKPKIKASEKIHRRYILISGVSEKRIDEIILDYIGILGFAKAKPIFIKDKSVGKNKIKKSDEQIILGVDRKSLNEVKMAFEFCKDNIKIDKISGTIKGLNK